jgi:putative transcriptional regulator
MAKQTKSPHSELSDGVPAPAGAISDIVATAGGDTVPEFDLNLTNHFLIAMPLCMTPCLAVAWCICVNITRGAMGMVINRPTDMTVAELFDRIDLRLEVIPDSHPMGKHLVMFGTRYRMIAVLCCILRLANILLRSK